MEYKRFVSALYIMNIVIQSIFTLLTPPAVLFGISWLLVSKAGAPSFLYAISLSVGFILGIILMIRFVVSAMENLSKLEKQKDNYKWEKTNGKQE